MSPPRDLIAAHDLIFTRKLTHDPYMWPFCSSTQFAELS